jgi:hypothetical protein
VFLLRKGGIGEKDGVFRLEEEEFFIFQTYEHQNAEDLQGKYRPWLEDSRRLAAGKDRLDVDVYARADAVFRLQDPEQVKKVLPFCVWSEDFLKKRLGYKPEEPLNLVFVRCYRTPHPHRIALQPEYAGCVSWVALRQPLSPVKFYPVLSAEVFEERKKRVLEALGINAAERKSSPTA